MRKITFLLGLFFATLSYGQVVLEDFESYPASDLSFFEGASGANIVDDPVVGASNQVLEIVSEASGNPWQGASMILQNNYVDLTTDKSIQMDIYSTDSFGLLVKVEDGQSGAPVAGADVTTDTNYVGGSGWQTITITFDESLDSSSIANGEYGQIVFFAGWDAVNDGWAVCCTPGQGSANTIYIDNIRGVQGSAITTSAPDPIPSAPPAIPTAADGDVYSVFNDTNNYTTVFPFAYEFGPGLEGQVDLDASAAVNNSFKFKLGDGGYGQGEESTTGAINAYDHVSFDYWLTAPTNGSATGTGFKFILISDNTTPVTEVTYEIGTNEMAVTEAWTKVSIPLSYFTNLGFDQAEFFQWKIDPFASSVDNNSIMYMDNFIFTNGNILSVDNLTTSEFNVYPNPTSNNWNIESNNTINTVNVFDILGKRVISVAPNTNMVKISTSDIKAGMYFARIEGANGSQTIKLIKE